MAKKDTESEHKSLPPSEKKLRDGRKKGQVSSSRDLISGFGILVMIGYLLLVWPRIRDHVLQLVDLVARGATQPFTEALRVSLASAMEVTALAVIPAAALLIFTSVIAGMIGTFGPVFSFDPVKPNFEHVNPAAGLKRIFSMRNAVEFCKGLLKVVILGGVLFYVLRSWMQPMFHTANCGEHCLVPLLLSALLPIAAVAALSFILIGFMDVRIQRWLFLRDMRMTKTEHKRERKDIEGDPLILGERKRERQRQGRTAGRLGLATASVVVTGAGHTAGLRYHKTQARIPVIVAKSRDDRAAAMREEARLLGIPVVEDEQFARSLVERHGVGDYIQQQYFAEAARILVSQNLT